jgi:sterol desaturase/sphingolipid hydroxylase (fatty acid hydroxylase superfamily)
MSAVVPVAALAAWALLLFALERVAPLRAPTRRLGGRLAVNATLTALSLGAALALVRPAVGWVLAPGAGRRLGLLGAVELPWLAEAVAAFAFLDLTFYAWHRANHAVPFLWRFHNVHHLDPDLDVTTATRFHFGEVALSATFRAAQVLALGAPLGILAAYELAFQAGVLFHHANLRLPLGLERTLLAAVVTPRMHGIHHSTRREETSANYGVLFTAWDRLFRSLRLDGLRSPAAIGVPGYARPEDNRLPAVLLHPFRGQRPYWPADPAVRTAR